MGNQQIIDISLRLSQKAVSKTALSNELSINEVFSSSRDIFVNTKNKELKKEVFNIEGSEAHSEVVFITNPQLHSSSHFKEILKIELTQSIYLIQFSQEFKDFMKKFPFITSTVELVNLFNTVIEENISPELIYRHVAHAFYNDSNSSYVINFTNASNYTNGLKYYVTSLQRLYIANTSSVLLQAFMKDSRTSTVSTFLYTSLNNITNGEKVALILSIGLFIILMSFCVFSYIYVRKHEKMLMKKKSYSFV